MNRFSKKPEQGREDLVRMAETLSEEDRRVAAATGIAAVNAARTSRQFFVSVIPGTAKRIEYHRGFTAVDLGGNPPSNVHDYPIRRFLELNPELLPEELSS